MAPQGNLGDVQLLAPVHPLLPAVQTSFWGSRVDGESTSAGLDINVATAVQAAAPVSLSAALQVETQAPAQTSAPVPAGSQAPGPVSAQDVGMPQTPASILANVPASDPNRVSTVAQGTPKVSYTNMIFPPLTVPSSL